MVVNKVLITGSSGFVGRYLKSYLLSRSIKVQEIPADIDIRDKNKVYNFCLNYSFDAVVHLAAQSFIPRSIEDPKETNEINFTGTLNLLEGLREAKFSGVFLFVGSSDVYGIVPESLLPIRENLAHSPINPYAKSKSAAEFLCKKWSFSKSGMRIIMTRSFNHIGPMQDQRFVISRFCKQVALIKCGLQESNIRVGNLNVTRDFTDVRDVVRAYLILLEKGSNGSVYNVCSGQEISLKNILPILRQIANIDFSEEVCSDLYRDAEQVRVFGSFNKIKKDLGWFPKILFKQSLEDTYNYWIDYIKKDNK
jgi:GDP-4-dehydro-6-deoxy-D-mannose reductase